MAPQNLDPQRRIQFIGAYIRSSGARLIEDRHFIHQFPLDFQFVSGNFQFSDGSTHRVPARVVGIDQSGALELLVYFDHGLTFLTVGPDHWGSFALSSQVLTQLEGLTGTEVDLIRRLEMGRLITLSSLRENVYVGYAQGFEFIQGSGGELRLALVLTVPNTNEELILELSRLNAESIRAH